MLSKVINAENSLSAKEGIQEKNNPWPYKCLLYVQEFLSILIYESLLFLA